MNYINNIEIKGKSFFPKKIEAITVSVGYADFLRQTLPHNRVQFDRLIVVTSSADKATQALCEYWHVECLVTDSFYENGNSFNKANGINEGLQKLSLSDWVCHLDADIYLPPRSREILNLIKLDRKNIYGIDRVNCVGFINWLKYLKNPERIHGGDGFLRLTQFPVGARLLNLDRDGYLPIGYFQLWNPKGADVFNYPDSHGAADRTDALFALQWEREKRVLLPEIFGIHLESELAVMGANWKGRKTKEFEI